MGGIFVAGTDTGVGKTRVACALAAALRASGCPVGVMKPVETGGKRIRGRLAGGDARALALAAGVEEPQERINPWCAAAPIAPHIAAAREGRPIRFSALDRAYREMRARYAFLIVEGAGGLLVPLNRRLQVIDLPARWNLPVLLVARPGLGTLNHTQLAVEALRCRRIPLAGIVVNYASPPSRERWPRFSERTNVAAIEELTGRRVLGIVPHRPGADAKMMARYCDIGSIMKAAAASRPIDKRACC